MLPVVPASKDGKRAIRSIGSLWQKDLACLLGSSGFSKICFLDGKSRLTQLPYRTDSLMLILIFTGHLSRVAPSTLSVRVCFLRVSFSASLCTLRQETRQVFML